MLSELHIPSILLTALLANACVGPVDLQAPPGGDSGAMDDTGLGDEDSGTGDGGGEEGCGLAQLSWQSKILDPAGMVLDQVPAGQPFMIAGRVSNPCHLAVTLDLPGSCLVEAFDVIDLASGDSDYEDLSCLQTASRAEVPPGAYLETLAGWRGLPSGEYRATAWFAIDRQSASTTFVVSPD